MADSAVKVAIMIVQVLDHDAALAAVTAAAHLVACTQQYVATVVTIAKYRFAQLANVQSSAASASAQRKVTSTVRALQSVTSIVQLHVLAMAKIAQLAHQHLLLTTAQ